MKLFSKNIGFFIPYFLFLFIGLFLILQFSEKEIFLFINSHNHLYADYFFYFYTFVGDGIFAILIFLGLSFIKIRYTITGLAAWGVQGILVQASKRLIFSDQARPWVKLGKDSGIYLIPGFEPYSNNSFPSGHSSTAFCALLLLSLFFANKKLGFIFFIIALLAAYSRIYLAQHFFIDIYVGSILGVIIAIIAYIFIYRPNSVHNHRWLDKPIHKLGK